MLPLTGKSQNHINMQQNVTSTEKNMKTFAKDKNNQKVRDHCHYTG